MLIANETQNAEARQLIHTLNGIIHSDQHIAEKTEQIARVIRQYKLLLALENPDTSELKFSNTHFKQRLSEAYPELSRNEIEICLLVRLNYSYKEIASKRKVSDQAVKVNMFRIRKKIGVESNTALSQILLEI
jgi:DNA-binding NarL/FixJ family response regulator